MWLWSSRRQRRAGHIPLHSKGGLCSEQLETRHLLSAVALWDPLNLTSVDSLSISQSTGEKPQSKVWEHDGQWWGVLPNGSGTSLWRLDSGSWTKALQLSSDSGTQADVKVVGNLAHVLMFQGSTSELVTLEYGAGGSSGYGFWTTQPNVVNVPLGSSVEMATIEVDTTGRMWVAYDRRSTVEVRYSDGPYTSFSAPINVTSGISSDDISAVVAMPNGRIGIFWSNQNSKQFGFKTHVDGASALVWSADEVPSSQSAKSTGGGFADDHVNLATSSDGTLYAAIKTSYDKITSPSIMLLVRRPSGVWDNAYTVANSGTRPIVVVSEAHQELAVIYTDVTGGGNIVLRGSPLGTIQFGPTQTLIPGILDDVTSSKAAVGNKILLLATRNNLSEGRLIDLGSSTGQPPTNNPPQVKAGSDLSITLPNAINLNGTASDDGRPTGTLSTAWSKVSGPGTVTFGNSSALATTAIFNLAGSYVLRLTANDGSLQTSDELTVDVSSPNTTPGPTTVSFQNGLNGYQGARDTMLQSTNPNGTSGIATSLNADGSPDASVLISWDIGSIPQGSLIQSATMTLQVTNSSKDTYPIYALNRSWSESQATWNVATQGVNWSAAGGQGSADRGTTMIGQLIASSLGQRTITLNTAGIALVQSWVNSPGSNYGIIIQNYLSASDGADFASREAAISETRPKLTVTYNAGGGAVTNNPPQVNAGGDQSITLPGGANLNGTASDDGQPTAALTAAWSMVSGPGTVTFGNPGAISSTASFNQAGTYVLQLTASDGSLHATDQVTIQANQSSAQSSSGLVGWWTMDGDGNDDSGQANHGTLSGSTSYGAGHSNSALLLASSGSRLLVPDSDSLDLTNAITMAGWISPTKSGTQYVIAKKEHGVTDGYELSLSSSGKVFVRFNEKTSGDSNRVDSSAGYPTNGQTWMHVAATYDGSTIKLYINGQLQGSKAANFQIATNALPLSLGAEQSGYRGMTGALDDVRIYSRALSAAEVAALSSL